MIEITTQAAGQNYSSNESSMSFSELIGILWDGRILIVSITTVIAVISVVFALSLPNIYRAKVLLAPTDGPDAASSLSAKFGGLASLAGVNIGAGGGNNTQLAIEVIKSRQFFKEFVASRGILVNLMAAKGWNQKSNELLINYGAYDPASKAWVRDVKPPKQPQPSISEAYKVFKKVLTVHQNEENGFVTISIDHVSPYVARDWAMWLVEDVNSGIRKNDIDQAERSITYLQEQIRGTSQPELQNSFFELIKQQIEKIMLAKASPEYVFKVIDPSVIPEEKFKPKRALVCIFITLLGVILSLMLVFALHVGKLARAAVSNR